MRALLEGLGEQLKAFIRQRDEFAIVLKSPATETLPVLTVIEGLESDSDDELFWINCEPFADPSAYADALAQSFAVKHQAVRLAQENEGMAPWPPIPPSILNPGTPPARRIQQIAAFSRDLLPGTDQTAVWVLHPAAIADATAFNELLRDVLRHRFPDPWCHHIRFIIRGELDEPSLEMLTSAPRVRALQPDLGPDAILRHLEASVADRTVILDERIGNLLVLACADQAIHQFEAALTKYEIIRDYHIAAGNAALAAVALNGMGEALEKLGQLAPAGEHYEQAVILAGQGDHPPIPVLLNAIVNLGHVRQTEARWAEAAAWWDLGQQVAVVARNAPARVQSMECLGICQFRLGAREEAERTLIDASIIAAALEDLTACRGIVLRLCQYYHSIGAKEKEQERREQLAALGHEGVFEMADLEGLRVDVAQHAANVQSGLAQAPGRMGNAGSDMLNVGRGIGTNVGNTAKAWHEINAPVHAGTPDARPPTTAEKSARVLRAAQQTVAGITSALGSVKTALDVGFADLTAPLAAIAPSLPAATMASMYVGTPHAHPSHPPSGPPPVPPTPCPSIGVVTLGPTPRVLINSMPAARCDDIGLAPTCMGLPPAWFKIKTGSSNVMIGGARAARMGDICIACKNIPDPPPISAGKVMAALGKAASVASKAMHYASIASGALGIAANIAEAEVEDDAAMAAGKALAAAMEAAQMAVDQAKAAVEKTMWKDPTLPPSGSLGAIIDPSHATVLIGGFPMVNIPDPVGALLNRLKRYQAPAPPEEEDGAGVGSCPG